MHAQIFELRQATVHSISKELLLQAKQHGFSDWQVCICHFTHCLR